MRWIAVVVLMGLAGSAVAERDRSEKQTHEWTADIDITLSQLSSSALIDIGYTWTPETLERYDEVVPALRRFVRRPSSLTAHIRHDGSPLVTRSTLEGGGTLQLLDGRAYLAGTGGIERALVNYSYDEDIYWSAPLGAEVGGRPLELLSLGVFYKLQPIFAATATDQIMVPAYRSGHEQWFGGTVTGSTPGDQLLATVRAAAYRADWDFEGFHPGPMDVRGLHAETHLSWQMSSTSSLTVDGRARRERWDNRRRDEEQATFVGPDVERRVLALQADLGFLYWFRGYLGFHVFIGGGFETEPPLYYRDEGYDVGTLGYGRFGFGFVSRY